MIEQDKINWIEVNLPWYHHACWESAPKAPDMNERERAEFGISEEELREKVGPDLDAFMKLKNELDELQDVAVAHAREADILYTDYIISPEYDQIEKDFWKLHENDACIIARNAYIELKNKICTWTEQQPEWKEFQKRLEKFNEEEDKKSFSRSGLAMPGTLVEMEDGSIEMIGSINTSGGVCNDCMAFGDSMIVKRYAVVYPFIRKKASDDES